MGFEASVKKQVVLLLRFLKNLEESSVEEMGRGGNDCGSWEEKHQMLLVAVSLLVIPVCIHTDGKYRNAGIIMPHTACVFDW